MKKYMALLLTISLISTFSACASDTKATTIKVKTEMAEVKEMQTTSEIASVLVPKNTQNISSKMSAVVESVNVEVGQEVKQGDTLIILDAKELEAQLAQAQANYNVIQDQSQVAKSNLDSANTGVSTAQNSLSATKDVVSDQIIQAEINLDTAEKNLLSVEEQNKVQLDQAKTNVDVAQTNYDRVSMLYNAGTISEVEMDNAQNTLDSAKSQYELVVTSTNSATTAAKSQYDAASVAYNQATGSGANNQITVAENNVAGAQSKANTAKVQYNSSSTSTLEQAQAAINVIETQISNATITAPIDGTVVNTNIAVGELAQPGTPLVTVVDDSTLLLNGNIPQDLLPYVKEGQTVDVVVDVYPDQPIKGKVESVGPMAVSTGAYFPVQISIPKTNENIMSGMTAHASINISKKNTISVPENAIAEENGETFVYIIENGVAIKKSVVKGLESGDQVEILNGLKEGETFATTNVNALFDQMPVEVEAQPQESK